MEPGVRARRLAMDALLRIDRDGAYANLALPPLLAGSDLSDRDRAFVTELVYGSTRMRRACDWLVDRFVTREPDAEVRAALRLGAYQLVFLDTPAHAAVSATVGATPRRARGFVNAVLRRVADAGPPRWPSEGIRLSYPDWIVERLGDDLGPEAATAAMEAMNRPAVVTERSDGYVQDQASQWVGAHVGASAGERVADLCAAPGGKATLMHAQGARVFASDRSLRRVGLIAMNRRDAMVPLSLVVADGRAVPYRDCSFDRVLVDAPCTGLGVLRRRPDARWRIEAQAVERLAGLQGELLEAAAGLVRPGGRVVYSVCTLTVTETVGVADRFEADHRGLQRVAPPTAPWDPVGPGALLLPQWADTDGMFVAGWTLPT